jgi:S1-C subfamily serine protease
MTISCQIDAPINRGNSGGLSFNLHGQVIGIDTAIYLVSGESVRIGFAAPANIAKSSSRPAQGTLARQPPLSSANLAVCVTEIARWRPRLMGGRRHWTTALVFPITELTPLGAAISDQRCAPRRTNEGVACSRYDL